MLALSEKTAYRLTIAADILLMVCSMYVLCDETAKEIPDDQNTILALIDLLVGAALLIYTTHRGA